MNEKRVRTQIKSERVISKLRDKIVNKKFPINKAQRDMTSLIKLKTTMTNAYLFSRKEIMKKARLRQRIQKLK